MGYNIAFSGLTAAAEAIDVTSNNIANSQTVGYKAGQYVFADEFYRAQDPQSQDRSGMGTQRQVIRRDQSYGTVTGTQNPLDLALTGPGMFVLAKQASNNVPTETPSVFQYTRNGQFGVDSQNRIVNESGMFVVGYPATPDGTATTQASFSVLTLDPTPKPANPSTKSTIALNINNGGNTIQSAFDPNNTASYTQSTSQTVYDSAGNPHTLSNFYAKTDPATLYLYPQGGGGSRTSATQFSFNPMQDTSPQADLFGGTNNLTGVISGVGSTNQIATTALASQGGGNGTETLQGCTLTALPAGQTSTYQLTLNDGTNLMVTAQPGVDGQGNQITRYAYTADRYKVYSTVDGINVNRSIDVSSQIGNGYTPTGVLTAFNIPGGGIASSDTTTSTDVTNKAITIQSPAIGGDPAHLSVTVSHGKITAVTVTNGGSGFSAGNYVIPASSITAGDSGTFTVPIASTGVTVGNSTVSAVSVGGAITGSAPAGTYTLRSQQTNNALSAAIVVNGGNPVLGLGGVAGTYSVPVNGGGGSGGVALINYGGNGVINGVQLSGGSTYVQGQTLTIPAGALGSGSTALTLGAIGSGNLLTGTFIGMQDAGGNNVLSAQAVVAGSAGGVQTFTFSNGVSITMNTPATDSVGAIAGNLNGKKITIANNPVGTMGFVAGKNIDSLARDQFGVPAYTTNTTITTSVGSGLRVNNLALNIDSTNMTAYTAAEQTYTSTTNGNPLSQLTGFSFDNKGNLVASYGDGTTMIKGQLAIASFNNAAGLIPVGLNSYQVSGTTGTTSGAAIYGTANSGNLGAVQGKAVESSNVDLTGELVKLMTLQRLYTANSQAVKVEAATIVDDAIRIGQ
jgi:flagellar hook-basal body protein